MAKGEDQLNIVVSGRVGTRVGGNEAILEAGGMQLMPRGVPHELWNAGTETARLIEITPPGVEHRFALGGQHSLADAAAHRGRPISPG
ncbi:MAG: cupin domain-containing protein [Terracoccus sp.]